MQLSLEHRQVGYVTVITCRGRLVLGPEADALMKLIDELLPVNRRILLHLGDVEFIDSGGLGLVVRCLTRVQNARGQLSLCALSPKVSDVLRITKLDAVLRPYVAEVDAIAFAHTQADAADHTTTGAAILCADASSDVLAYLRGLLKGSGYRVVTATNLYDAAILLKAMRPSVVVISARLHAMHGTHAADDFHRHVPAQGLVVLPPNFSSHEAGDAGRTLLSEIGTILNREASPS